MNKLYTLETLLRKLDLRIFKRIPVVFQTEASECGLACLSMICSFYGKQVDLLQLRQQFNLSSRGVNLHAIKAIASELEMSSRALSVDLQELHAVRKPCILHWDFNHFVVLIKVDKNSAVIHDPAFGRRVISMPELSQHFTGVVLEVWPGTTFSVQKKQNRLKASTLLKNINGLMTSLAKIFFLSLVIELISLLLPVGTQLVTDNVIASGDYGLLNIICLGLFILILLRLTISIIRSWTMLILGTLIDVQWSFSLFSHLIKLPTTFFERRKLGDIQSRFHSLDVIRATFTTGLTGSIIDTLMLMGLLVMMFLYNLQLSMIVVSFTAIYTFIRFATYRYYRQLSEEELIKEARLNSYFMETLYGIATIKIQGMTDLRINNWFNLFSDKVNTGIRLTRMDLFFGGVVSFIAACDQIVILWVSGRLMMDSHLTIGMFIAFNTFRSQFYDRINALINFIIQLKLINLYNERVADIALQEASSSTATSPLRLPHGALTLETQDLTYRYDNHADPIFSKLNLTIHAGESIAITGVSGAGKSTLMKVLCGLFEPSNGCVRINGIDIKQLGFEHYAERIACIMQEDKLFSGSIKENITGFRPDIDEQWMVQCAIASHIHNDILKLPMGYETLIGELGEGLSGGQKQRIYIARALYRKPGILFMDEATSHLDKTSESQVNQSIQEMNITRIIIAHRETTISSADRVFVINGAELL
ncbi:peptidase domain-containing ABC transporter [Enterobacter asburiae]|uniref:peptidase domain-containing ABC transporter n=1 Tax=Enterobacter asburiae TaxID=61645 RepID=UPI0005EE6301|nr:peptidase domain-containing ABC transporter [Enterobacter asburiae]MBS7118810.1 peptidase domain-containing ABC transporter [Enterobacter cloacae]KJP19865.1 colicin V synthesis protein [Enterobacter asburiae]KOQ87473.1 colicin V synthesis protein [Enterobacter asburiae]MCM7648495.1 peptidase domain-containing ABC transporter [Enterobacter asburiae]MCM7671728.1 peptidase domain-containing ABC transporter [Enterobacter asburiae]